MSKRVMTALRKSPCCKGFFLFLPFVFGVLCIGCAVVLLFQSVIAPSEYYRVLMGSAGGVSNNNVVQEDEGYIPTIMYESQWATLNVEGWKERDIPVYFGDNDEILRRGAGMWMNSRFCGQLGKTVLSAHVTSYFHEIEDTAIGTQVTVDTIYGDYVYEVIDIKLFNYQDSSLIKPGSEAEDTLLMYTCYPRENGYQFKTQRIALICKKVSGKEWKTYG